MIREIPGELDNRRNDSVSAMRIFLKVHSAELQCKEKKQRGS